MKHAFTLIELLVVVLIIGILSAIALPQYQRTIDKSRTATMLPLMKRWLDAMTLYKLENGSYCLDNNQYCPSGDELGVAWPSDWDCSSPDSVECNNDKWYCFSNEEQTGHVYCSSLWKRNDNFTIFMTQVDDPYYPAGKRFCLGSEKGCKFLGGTLIEGTYYYEF